LERMHCGRTAASAISCSAVLGACEKSSQWECALWLLHRLRPGIAGDDSLAVNTAISACEKAGRWEDALAFLADMFTQHTCRAVPDVAACSATLKACANVGRWAEALRLIRFAPKAAAPLDAAMLACEQGGHWDRCMIAGPHALVQLLNGHGRGRESTTRVFLPLAIARRLGDCSKALKVIERTVERNHYAPLLQGLQELQYGGRTAREQHSAGTAPAAVQRAGQRCKEAPALAVLARAIAPELEQAVELEHLCRDALVRLGLTHRICEGG